MEPSDEELRAAATRMRKEAEAKRRAEAGKRAEASEEAEARKRAEASEEAEAGEEVEIEGTKQVGGERKRKRRAVHKIVKKNDAEPTSKKPRSRSPIPTPNREPEAGVIPIDLTAETPSEERGVDLPSTPVIPRAEGVGTDAEPGFNMSVPADGPEAGAHTLPGEGTPTPTGVGEEEVAAASLQSILDRGRWAESVISQICLPEMQEGLLRQGSASFFRDTYASMLWVLNSFTSLRTVLTRAETVVTASRSEVSATQTRLEEVENLLREARAAEERANLALEEAQLEVATEAQKALETEGKLTMVEAKLRSAEEDIYNQEVQIFNLNTQARETKERADNAVQLAHYSDARAEALAKEVQTLKDKMAEGEEKLAEAEGRAVEADRKAAEADEKAAEADRKAAEAVAIFRQSAEYRRGVANAAAHAYDLGFNDCKLKIKQVFDLDGVDSIEPDSVEESPSPAPIEGSEASI